MRTESPLIASESHPPDRAGDLTRVAHRGDHDRAERAGRGRDGAVVYGPHDRGSEIDQRHPGDLGPAVGIRELARSVSAVVGGVAKTGRAVLVTKHGLPCAAIVPIRRGDNVDLAAVSRRLEDIAAVEMRAGRTQSSPEVFVDLARLAAALAHAASVAEPSAR